MISSFFERPLLTPSFNVAYSAVAYFLTSGTVSLISEVFINHVLTSPNTDEKSFIENLQYVSVLLGWNVCTTACGVGVGKALAQKIDNRFSMLSFRLLFCAGCCVQLFKYMIT